MLFSIEFFFFFLAPRQGPFGTFFSVFQFLLSFVFFFFLSLYSAMHEERGRPTANQPSCSARGHELKRRATVSSGGGCPAGFHHVPLFGCLTLAPLPELHPRRAASHVLFSSLCVLRVLSHFSPLRVSDRPVCNMCMCVYVCMMYVCMYTSLRATPSPWSVEQRRDLPRIDTRSVRRFIQQPRRRRRRRRRR